jgi:hypothetical protein
MELEFTLHYRKYIQSKLYHTMDFAEYLSGKLNVSESTAYQLIKQNKPVHA